MRDRGRIQSQDIMFPESKFPNSVLCRNSPGDTTKWGRTSPVREDDWNSWKTGFQAFKEWTSLVRGGCYSLKKCGTFTFKNSSFEVSQKEKDKHYINTYIWNLERWYWQSYTQGSKGDTDVKNRLLDSVGKGKGGMMWEWHWNMCITICKIADQQAWYITQGTQSWCSGTTQRDGMGKDVGGGFRTGRAHVHLWLIHVDRWQKPSQYCNYPPIKINKLKKNLIKKIIQVCCTWFKLGKTYS